MGYTQLVQRFGSARADAMLRDWNAEESKEYTSPNVLSMGLSEALSAVRLALRLQSAIPWNFVMTHFRHYAKRWVEQVAALGLAPLPCYEGWSDAQILAKLIKELADAIKPTQLCSGFEMAAWKGDFPPSVAPPPKDRLAGYQTEQRGKRRQQTAIEPPPYSSLADFECLAGLTRQLADGICWEA